MPGTQELRWGRIIIGGLLMELAMFAIVIPLNSVNRQATYYAVPFLTSAFGFLFGYWAAKPLQSRFVSHGILLAVAASLMYVALTVSMGVAASVPLLYHVSHGFRVIGGALGGRMAQKRVLKSVMVSTA